MRTAGQLVQQCEERQPTDVVGRFGIACGQLAESATRQIAIKSTDACAKSCKVNLVIRGSEITHTHVLRGGGSALHLARDISPDFS